MDHPVDRKGKIKITFYLIQLIKLFNNLGMLLSSCCPIIQENMSQLLYYIFD
jgi:hypothetical protein